MEIIEVLGRVRSLLQREGRLSYRILKMQFQLDDEQLETLKEELIDIQEVAIEQGGKMLIWTGDRETPASSTETAPQSPPPVSYTPPHLAERIRAEQAAMEARGSRDGERKIITALFADLKGSTALIEGLDPEEARAILDPALQLMMDAVHRYEGYVAQALGDGIFALFGAPIAHEDHPQRALYAALRMQEAMRQYSDTIRQQGYPPLLMRVGLNTGEVVLRSIRKDDLHTDYVPVGHTTNLAARMEQLAMPGSIFVTAYTYKLTEGFFEFKALGAATIKGVEAPLNVYEVLSAGPLRTRLQVSARRGLTRFVGRQSELDQLRQALEQAKAGHGQIVGVMGEPGLGKSRLFYEFKLTSQSGCRVLEAFAVSHGKASPYLPLIELLKAYFEIEGSDDDWKRREKVTGKVLTLDRSLEDTLPYLFALLGIEDPHSSLPEQMDVDAQIRRQRTFEALKKLFFRESLNQPVILIFEDLHWIDSETQGFLDTLRESVASANLLLLVNYRPEYRHDWGQKTYYTQLRLAPLGQAEAEELLTFLLGADDSLTALKSLILTRTEGTPFFMEEVVQTLVEEGALSGERGAYRLARATTTLQLSPTVQGVLAARIDRLTGEEKTLLQQLSVIGRQFPVSLVRHVVEQPAADLHRVLSSLQTKEFLYEQPAFPEVEYFFKHALTQEVTYGTVLHEQRKTLHERTAQTMEVLYKENLGDHYGELADHYSRSENAEKAVAYLQLAGEQAVQRAAYDEAITYLRAAVDRLSHLPDTPARLQRELSLQLALGTPLMTLKGWTDPEVEITFLRARDLSQQLGETPEHFTVLFGLWIIALTGGKLTTAFAHAKQCLRFAQDKHDTSLLLLTHYMLMCNSFGRGEFRRAHDHAERGIALYHAQTHGALALQYSGIDPGVACYAFAAYALWHLGYPDQALARQQQALRLGYESPYSIVLAYALFSTPYLYLQRRESAAFQEGIAAQHAFSQKHGFSGWNAWGSVFKGAALVRQNQDQDGIAQMEDGLALVRSMRVEWLRPQLQILLAEAYGKVGQPAAGLSVVSDALACIAQTGECTNEADLYRLRGELLLASQSASQPSTIETEAEAAYHQALEIARHQEAKSLELRAATSLARLWQLHGKTTEARDLLVPVYNWFTEGFDTADLKDAKALLDSLS